MDWRGKLAVAGAIALPSVVLRLSGVHVADPLALLVYGGAVVAAAFALSWAGEAAEADISGSLAVALLALVAVLPEFAVGLYFAFRGGHDAPYAQYATANVTGSNRLLFGFGTAFATLVFVWFARRRGEPADELRLPAQRRTELVFLLAASVVAVVVAVTDRLGLWAAVVLIALFGGYMWRISKDQQEEPELIGVAAQLAGLPTGRRRAGVLAIFVVAALVVLAAAEPFANSLIGTGTQLGVNRFLLVQWLAPLASEAPELIVATLFARRGRGDKGVGLLLSAEVNQWTLAVGALPVAYLAGGGGRGGLALDARQSAEFVLTIAQAVLGVAALVNLRFRVWEAAAMLVLFAAQFALLSPGGRLLLSAVYLVLALAILAREWRMLVRLPGTVLAPWLQPGDSSG